LEQNINIFQLKISKKNIENFEKNIESFEKNIEKKICEILPCSGFVPHFRL